MHTFGGLGYVGFAEEVRAQEAGRAVINVSAFITLMTGLNLWSPGLNIYPRLARLCITMAAFFVWPD